MKIHEDRSHMNIDTRWFEKGYAKEDVHSLRLQSLCTEAEAAANKQFYDSHTRKLLAFPSRYLRGISSDDLSLRGYSASHPQLP
jgi:hypothetical protein